MKLYYKEFETAEEVCEYFNHRSAEVLQIIKIESGFGVFYKEEIWYIQAYRDDGYKIKKIESKEIKEKDNKDVKSKEIISPVDKVWRDLKKTEKESKLLLVFDTIALIFAILALIVAILRITHII